jgi:hypothetical protein
VIIAVASVRWCLLSAAWIDVLHTRNPFPVDWLDGQGGV